MVSCADLVIVLCSRAKYFMLTIPLSSQRCMWVQLNCQGDLVGNFAMNWYNHTGWSRPAYAALAT